MFVQVTHRYRSHQFPRIDGDFNRADKMSAFGGKAVPTVFGVSANGPKGTSTNKNTEPKATPNDLPEPSLVRAMLGSLQLLI